MNDSVTGKTILYIITKGTWGGAQANVYDLMLSCKTQGGKPVLAYGEDGLLAERASKVGIELFQIPTLARDISFLDEFRTCTTIYKLIKKVRPDVVHLHSSKIGGVGAFAARLANAPHIIFTAHAWAFTEPRSLLYRAFFFLAHYATVLLCDKVILVSYRLKEFARFWPFVTHKMHVIENGIDNDPLLSPTESREALATLSSAVSFLHTDTHIVTIAELHDNKGLDIGIRAFSLLPPDVKEHTHWYIIGSGEREQELKELAHDEPHIHFLGFVPEASRLLKAFDIFMLPSRTESFGYVLLEAGRAKLPVIATRVGGIPEIITHQSTGLLVQSKDVTALSESLAYLILEKETRSHLANALHTRVTTHFTKKEMLSKTFALYDFA